MKHFLASLVCLLAVTVVAATKASVSPIAVGIAIDETSYVVGEDIPVRVMIMNNTPYDVILGRDKTPVATFEVRKYQSKETLPLHVDSTKLGLPTPLKLAPNQKRVFTVKLTNAVNMREEANYLVTFGAIYKGMRYDTECKMVQVVPGMIVSEGLQLFKKDPNRQRHFTLVRWTRQHVDRLFLRVEDSPDGQYFPTVMLGAYLPLVKPRLNIAANGEIVVLHRATPEYYIRNVFWSLTSDFVQRSQVTILDPSTADSARLNGLKSDFDNIIKQDEERRKENNRTIKELKRNGTLQ